MNRKDVYVVPHSHWDAEWYFTCEDSHILLVENLDYLINLLETRPDFPSYTFDGLAVVLDDYLAVRPENRDRLRDLITQRRLFVGPWYTQCDSLLIRTESLIRNLQCGIQTADGFGHSMNIGYLPDIFGMHAWLPAIFNDLGIQYCVLQRGVYTDQLEGDLNFYWRSPNDQAIATNYMYFGYGPGKFISTQKDYLQHRLLPILDTLSLMNQSTDKLLLPSGGDQVLANAAFPQIVEALNQLDSPYRFKMADFETYMDEVWSSSTFSNVIDGELFACQKSRIHRTCHSTRYDIKQQTWHTEHLLIDLLEPLGALAAQFGIDYPQRLVDGLWKTLFAAHAHNGIEATNADPVNANIKNRLVSVERSALSLINLLKKKISQRIVNGAGTSNILIIFNVDVSPLSGLVQAVVFTKSPHFALRNNGEIAVCNIVNQQKMDGGQIVIVTAQGEKLERVDDYYRSEILLEVSHQPGLGYHTFTVDECQHAPGVEQTDAADIENDTYRVSLRDGRLTLANTRTGQRIDDFLTFVDDADDGDEFDYAPLAVDNEIVCQTFTRLSTVRGELSSVMTLRSTLALPQSMASRLQGTPDSELVITTTLELRKGESFIRVQHALVNQQTEHRLRVKVKTPVAAPLYSFADQGFSVLRRNAASEYVEGWRERGFVEKPVPIYTLENIVYLQNEQHFMGVMPKGIKEYEVIPADDSIALTLFRSVGLLGKDDTLWRPGRASGINNKVVETPDALMLQPMQFDYAIRLDQHLADDAAIFNTLRAWRNQDLSYHVQTLNTFEERLERFTIPLSRDALAPAMSMLTLKNPHVMMSLCKPGERPGEIVVRLFNPGSDPQRVQFDAPARLVMHALSLREKRVGDDADEFIIAPHDYLTLSVRFAGENE
nr:glycoside hydrolase family 38 C-terminal domain-containing protein [uncultured Enterobacter sp.]